MNSFQLCKYIDNVLPFLEDEHYLMTSLQQISDFGQQSFNIMSTLVDPESLKDPQRKDNTAQVVGKAQGNLRKFTDALRKAINTRQLYVELHKLKSTLSDYGSLYIPDSSGFMEELKTEIQQFESSYEAYINVMYGFPEILVMLLSGRELHSELITFREMLLSIRQNLYTEVLTETGESFSLYLISAMDFKNFLGKLQALQLLYEALAELFGISLAEHPLRIMKVESGSLLSMLKGEPVIVKSMVKLIENAAGWCYRKFTKEGKIATIPRNIDAIEDTLSLRKLLQEQGINTEEMDEHIQKASIGVAKQLNTLLAGQPSIEINGKRISVESELEQQYLQESRQLMLEEHVPDENSNGTSEERPSLDDTSAEGQKSEETARGND